MANRFGGNQMVAKSFYTSNQVNHYLPSVVAYYYKEWQNFQMPFHSHEAVEIMYVISGDCKVELETEMITIKKGHFIIIDACIRHRLLVDAGKSCRMLNVEFTLESKQGVFPSIKELSLENEDLHALLQNKQPFLVLKDMEGFYYTLKSVVIELSEKKNDNSSIIIQTLVSHLLLMIARLAAESRNRTPLPTDIYIKKVINYIHHNYDCDLNVTELASITYLHPSYLHRIFKEGMGCTIMEYITNIRMEKAKMLLSKTEIPISEISDYIGINSRQYFSYLFKKTTGKAPKNYRQKSTSI